MDVCTLTKPEQYAEIAPDMRVVVLVVGSYVVITTDSSLTSRSSSDGADERITNERGIGRDDARACELAAMELVCNKDFESIVDWI